MMAPLSEGNVEVRPLWVLPDIAGLAHLADGQNVSVPRCSATLVGQLLGADTGHALVLVQFDDLTATQLSDLVGGNTPVHAKRVTLLPNLLDPVLGCLAPSLARARRLVVDAREEDGGERTFFIDARDLPGGVVECARIEAQRLFPDGSVEIAESGHESLDQGVPSPSMRNATPSDDELAVSLGVLRDHSVRFRPVIVAALGNDELALLQGLFERLSIRGHDNLSQYEGRVVVRALAPIPLPHQFQSEPKRANATAPRPGTPAARALEKVAAVSGYRRGRAVQGNGSDGKLSANEIPFGPPPAVRAALRATSESLNRYPEEDLVLEQLAKYLDVDVERVLLTNGSDELCYLLARLLLDDSPNVIANRRQGFTVVGDPCYQIDATASILAGAPIVKVPLDGGAHDLSAMARAAGDGATLVWLPSPHNPTGVSVAPEDLVTFLDKVPGDCLVVLDEAYGGFTRHGDPDASLKIGESRPNLLVQRTFSKDWGLAGLRVGYAVGDAALIGALRRARPPFSVNSMALAAVSAVLGCSDWRASTVTMITEERTLLESTLQELGITYFPSEANFVTCAVSFPDLRDALTSEGLSVRDGGDLGLPGWTRITVGWAPQMAALRNVLRHHLVSKG